MNNCPRCGEKYKCPCKNCRPHNGTKWIVKPGILPEVPGLSNFDALEVCPSCGLERPVNPLFLPIQVIEG